VPAVTEGSGAARRHEPTIVGHPNRRQSVFPDSTQRPRPYSHRHWGLRENARSYGQQKNNKASPHHRVQRGFPFRVPRRCALKHRRLPSQQANQPWWFPVNIGFAGRMSRANAERKRPSVVRDSGHASRSGMTMLGPGLPFIVHRLPSYGRHLVKPMRHGIGIQAGQRIQHEGVHGGSDKLHRIHTGERGTVNVIAVSIRDP
jgi:hypothetical protein